MNGDWLTDLSADHFIYVQGVRFDLDLLLQEQLASGQGSELHL